MNIIDLVRGKGIDPRRASSNKGGEYHSSCPLCGDGGKGAASDRFHIWLEQNGGEGSFWCRQCDRGGDAIELIMAMDGLSYKEACVVLGKDACGTQLIPMQPRTSRRKPATTADYQPSHYQQPVAIWRDHAEKFAQWAHEQLIENHPEQMIWLADRGLDPSTVIRWGLGWNPGKDGKDLFRTRESWGLETITKDNGNKKKLWIPKGLIIPYRRDGILQRIRIRRPKADLRNNTDPRYYVLPGSSAMPWLIGENRRAYIVVETELDALLIDQDACPLTGVLALGSASNMPDDYCHQHLAQALVILNALDFDQAGGKACTKWPAVYPQCERWPVPVGKDPGDAHTAGIDIHTWILAGLPPAWHVGPSPFIAQGLKGMAVSSQSKPGAAQTIETPLADSTTSTVIAATVRELGELLQRYPVRIVNTAKRTAIETPQRFNNDQAGRRISELVFMDHDCSDYLLRHPAKFIDGRNFYHG